MAEVSFANVRLAVGRPDDEVVDVHSYLIGMMEYANFGCVLSKNYQNISIRPIALSITKRKYNQL